MKIGNLDIGNKLFVAPMAEVSDSPFRKIAKEHGAGLAFTQMINALGAIRSDFDTLRHLSFNRSEKPIGVQVLGKDPGILGEAVKEISKSKPDLIDLNCGCPVEKVVCHNMGAALLDDSKKIGTIVRTMVDSSSGVPISIKVRLGKDKSKINIIDIAKSAESNGASLIFIHTRTRADKYDSDPDWSWLKKVKESIKIPVVGNGSLFSPIDIKRMIDETGCDSAMIARGSLGNPFIFDRFNSLMEKGIDPGEPGAETVKHVLLKHIKLLVAEYGELLSIDKSKKQSIWYFRMYPGVNQFLDKVFASSSIDELVRIIEEHTKNILSGVYNHHSTEEINKKFKKKVLFWLTDESVESLG
ncbi:MAG: tRNA dihydrouridine synthase DusB [Bacteroidota bacterium]